MPLFDESVVFSGASSPSDMSGFIAKPVLHYGGLYFSNHTRGTDAAEFTSPWTNSSTSLQDTRSPTTHASGAETSNDNSSGEFDNPVHIAIPKAVYGHNPCYRSLGCMMGHRYTVEHRAQAADFEPGEEEVKKTSAENLSRGRPAQMEPNYSGFSSLSPLSMLTLSEQRRHLQSSPGGYASLPPSHTNHEHMTSELYQECFPMSKYGHPTKHSMFYYPRGNVEVENRTYCRDISGKQRALNCEIPLFLHSAETQPSHSFVQGFDYPCYAHPRFHLSPVQNVERQHIQPGLPSHRVTFSPSDQHLSPQAACLQRRAIDQLVGPLETSHSTQHMDSISPTRHASPFVLPSPNEMSKLYPSINSRLNHQMDESVLSPSALAKEQYSSYEDQVSCLKDFTISRGMRHPHSVKIGSDLFCSTSSHGPNSQTVIVTGNKHNRFPHYSPNSALKGGLKRRIKEEPIDLCETELIKRQKKLEIDELLIQNQPSSPGMPVIDTVFSLAPVQEGLETSRILLLGEGPQKGALWQVKPTTPPREIKPDPAGPPAHVCEQMPEVQLTEPAKIKVEKTDQSDTCDASENSPSDAIQDETKPQAEDVTLSTAKPMLVIQISAHEGLECKTSSLEDNNPSLATERPSEPSVGTPMTPQVTNESKPVSPLGSVKPKLVINNLPPEFLNLNSDHNSQLPALKCFPPVAAPETPEQIRPKLSPTREKPIRKRFLELHRTLLKQVAKCVFGTSEQQLSTWRSQLGLKEPSSNKAQKVSCLLGMKARHKWFNEEISSALQEVQDRFKEYIVHERCPFPHVMRTGAVFLPMLVVKEILFPIVPGAYVDQVLQEHKVELRPTTLSEEKILAQLHKPCSSRLGRLMSLKHLPDVYTDVLNLFYYSSVCKHLGVDVAMWDCSDVSGDSSQSKDVSAASSGVRSTTKTKSRIKSSCRRLFLDSSPSEDEGEKAEREGTSPSSVKETLSHDSWTHPLTFEDFAGSDVEPGESSRFLPVCLPAQPVQSQKESQNSSEIVIKVEDGETGHQREHRRMTFKWRRTGSSGRILRPLGASQKPKKRLLKIKYCPYLSACHSAERRRRWVLRSAVRRARGASGLMYPDLVGKRIRHLYEEHDKSEVWYRGEVIRIHEANTDPLKTIFEVCYDSEPEWKYYLELFIDYKKGWLIIEDLSPQKLQR
ncbi:uncharacterized protein C15orf39 homolog isoform X2 [Stigmatopora argus]